MESIEIYLDLDGVLADFDKSINEKKLHLEELEETIWEMVPKLRGKSDIIMKQFFRGEQTDPILKKAKRVYNVYRSKFFDIMEKPGFFLDLEPMPGYMTLVNGVRGLNSGKLPHILTAPVQTEHCPEEKKQWCDKYLAGKYDRFICQKNKTEYAEPFAILIDDMTKNTVPWDAAGGFSVLHTGNVKNTLRQVAEFIDEVQKV